MKIYVHERFKFDAFFRIKLTQIIAIYCYPQALHTYRINLSPFTKDFRVWGASIETHPISHRPPLGWLLNFTNRWQH